MRPIDVDSEGASETDTGKPNCIFYGLWHLPIIIIVYTSVDGDGDLYSDDRNNNNNKKQKTKTKRRENFINFCRPYAVCGGENPPPPPPEDLAPAVLVAGFPRIGMRVGHFAPRSCRPVRSRRRTRPSSRGGGPGSRASTRVRDIHSRGGGPHRCRRATPRQVVSRDDIVEPRYCRRDDICK